MPKLQSRSLTDNELEWVETSKQWKIENLPDHDGYWYCKVGGGALTDGKQDALGGLPFNLCHDIARARDNTKKHDFANLYPGCPYHNRDQGSRSLAEYRESNPRKRCGC